MSCIFQGVRYRYALQVHCLLMAILHVAIYHYCNESNMSNVYDFIYLNMTAGTLSPIFHILMADKPVWQTVITACIYIYACLSVCVCARGKLNLFN